MRDSGRVSVLNEQVACSPFSMKLILVIIMAVCVGACAASVSSQTDKPAIPYERGEELYRILLKEPTTYQNYADYFAWETFKGEFRDWKDALLKQRGAGALKRYKLLMRKKYGPPTADMDDLLTQ